MSASSSSRVSFAGPETGFRQALGITELDAAAAMIVVAHPDDETIGIGGHLGELSNPLVVHATDGAPRDMEDARRYGFATSDAYANARRCELVAAMREAGVCAGALLGLGVADQEAARHLPVLARKLTDLFESSGTRLVFTHAFEGGHPDHDAVAFAVHAASQLLQRRGGKPPLVIDMPFYRAEVGRMITQSFAAKPHCPQVVLPLSPARRQGKRRMLACFRSQQKTLAPFQLDAERVRRAPAYDFTKLPETGPLYDSFPWGIRGAEWLMLARAALAELRLATCH